MNTINIIILLCYILVIPIYYLLLNLINLYLIIHENKYKLPLWYKNGYLERLNNIKID